MNHSDDAQKIHEYLRTAIRKLGFLYYGVLFVIGFTDSLMLYYNREQKSDYPILWNTIVSLTCIHFSAFLLISVLRYLTDLEEKPKNVRIAIVHTFHMLYSLVIQFIWFAQASPSERELWAEDVYVLWQVYILEMMHFWSKLFIVVVCISVHYLINRCNKQGSYGQV